MATVRRQKLWRDLFENRGRTVLVILAIAVGVAAFGMMITSQIVLARDVAEGYAATRPAHAVLSLTPFQADLADVVAAVDGVGAVESRRLLNGKIKTGPDAWNSLEIQAIDDFESQEINLLGFESGQPFTPPTDAVLLERSLRPIYDPAVGAQVEIKTLDGRVHEMELAGYVNDLAPLPASFSTIAQAYISADALVSSDLPASYNRLFLRLAAPDPTRAEVETVVTRVVERVEAAGHQVFAVEIPQPGAPIFQENLDSVVLMLGTIGVLTLLLSALLVFNMMSAVISQQIPQVGILKSLGGRRRQVIALYLQMVLLMGGVALVIAVPLGAGGAYVLTRFLAETMMDFDIVSFRLPLETVILQIGSALLVPVLGALLPIFVAARISIREAIGDFGTVDVGMGVLGKLLLRLRGLSKLTHLSIRNTFRRRGRLALTLAALSMGGAMFVAVIGVRLSLDRALDDALQDLAFDVELNFARPYPVELIENTALEVEGVADIELQMNSAARRVYDDGRLSGSIFITGLSPTTEIARPKPISGQWLSPDQENTIFVNGDTVQQVPDFEAGGTYTLRLGQDERQWRLVGTGSRTFTPRAYVDFATLQEITGLAGMSNRLIVAVEEGVSAFEVESALLDKFEAAGVRVRISNTTSKLRAASSGQLDGVVLVLLTLAVLVAIVGGLGLASTMGINVLERTREIGILRSLGATNAVVRGGVMAEGLVIGGISCVFALLFAAPLGIILGNMLGESLFFRPLDTIFSWWAAVLWVGLVLLISIIASLAPARSAARLTIRETLAYE